MSAETTGPGRRPRAGHTRISTQALTSSARIIASEVFDVQPGSIRVSLNDEFGALALRLSLPLPIAPLAYDRPAGLDASESVMGRARDARSTVRDRFVELTGSHVSRVDVRVTGVVLRRRRTS
ncbi:MAG: hypothetical protein L0J68_01710 [Micrococcaceae bacterium]|uniref:hypothetical protein n=1 Tax=Arthrobacter sp. AOP36-C1-22 TaxID=3457683 RepID=UPI00264C8221|nr:hypothetical protein [Micrococcaceae bacterium]MDN5812123.1 hypothetical protein [Micrococcaceae bacterium]MDN5824853.1 hypothetical protein [Micrococcaceae bacterium]MDN5877988.1 hypothetical protein [Micrococcaceae bacterium]MDN5885500.1 hypothetical protein [Micrococcaceae bacterium]